MTTKPQIVAELVALVVAEGGNPTFAARRVAADLPPRVARDLAARFLAERCRDEQRRLTLDEERAAMRAQIMQEVVASGGRLTPKARREMLTDAEREQRTCEDAEASGRFLTSLTEALSRYTEEVRVQWTADLLASTFARTDGTHVSWGAATLEDHRDRLAMFMRNAHANLEGAARHEQAIRELEAAGVSTLADLTRKPTRRRAG